MSVLVFFSVSSWRVILHRFIMWPENGLLHGEWSTFFILDFKCSVDYAVIVARTTHVQCSVNSAVIVARMTMYDDRHQSEDIGTHDTARQIFASRCYYYPASIDQILQISKTHARAFTLLSKVYCFTLQTYSCSSQLKSHCLNAEAYPSSLVLFFNKVSL